MRLWDTEELTIITRGTPGVGKNVEGTCCCIADDETVVTGWNDGFIRCYEMSKNTFSAMQWEIANAHKGAVSTVYADANYVLSGGEDALVRVWSRQVRKLTYQIAIHIKRVTRVFPDILKTNIIHSCSIDKTVHSYDLKKSKKVMFHTHHNGQILDMSQRVDHEQELVTCGKNMPILFWDCDIVDPVDKIEYPYMLLTCAVSPSGKYLAAGSETAEVLPQFALANLS